MMYVILIRNLQYRHCWTSDSESTFPIFLRLYICMDFCIKIFFLLSNFYSLTILYTKGIAYKFCLSMLDLIQVFWRQHCRWTSRLQVPNLCAAKLAVQRFRHFPFVSFLARHRAKKLTKGKWRKR